PLGASRPVSTVWARSATGCTIGGPDARDVPGLPSTLTTVLMNEEVAVPLREYGAGRPLVFSHIPKSAGTSLRASLRLALQPAAPFEGVDMSLAGAHNLVDDL